MLVGGESREEGEKLEEKKSGAVKEEGTRQREGEEEGCFNILSPTISLHT